MKKDILDRYSRTPDGRIIIDISAGNIADLYSYFDRSSPYHKKELDQELVDYLIESVREIGNEDFVIQFMFSEPLEAGLKERLQNSVSNYFIYLKELEFRELAGMRRTSLTLLAVGISIISFSVWFNRRISVESSVLISVFAEGLTVAAWISLWEALATFIVNWMPHRRQIRLYERVAVADIFFVEAASRTN